LLVSLLRARLYFSWMNLHPVRIPSFVPSPLLSLFALSLCPLTPPPLPAVDPCYARKILSLLVSLARNYDHAVVFTIHQLLSNVVAMFDKLVFLARGRMVYSGDYVASINATPKQQQRISPNRYLTPFRRQYESRRRRTQAPRTESRPVVHLLLPLRKPR
jgi:hypothetical protein